MVKFTQQKWILYTLVTVSILLIIGTLIILLNPKLTPNSDIYEVGSEGEGIFANSNPSFDVLFGQKDDESTQWIRFESETKESNPFDPNYQEEKKNLIEKISSIFQKEEKLGIEMSLSGVKLSETSNETIVDISDGELKVGDILGTDKVETSTELLEVGRSLGEVDNEQNISKETIVNQNVWKGVDLEYQVLEGIGVKEEIIVRSLESYMDTCGSSETNCEVPLNEFIFDLQLDKGVELHQSLMSIRDNPVGTYYFTDSKGNYLAHFLPSFAFDEGGSKTNNVDFYIEETNTNGLYKIHVVLDMEWILSAERVFPIHIDPSIVHDDSADFSTGILNRLENATGPKIQLIEQELTADAHTVGLWHMNEASGDSVADSSGNSNTGTATGTTITTGKFSNARSFNGIDDYIVLNSTFPSLTNNFSISFWVNPGSTQNAYADIFGNHASYKGIVFEQDNTTINSYYFAYGDGTTWISTNTVQLTANTWQHVTVSKDSTTCYIYLNGILNNTTACATSVSPSIANLTFGRSTNTSRDFSGLIDEVRISNIALTAEEIKADAQKRTYGIYTSNTLDLTEDVTSIDDIQWIESGVNTGDGEIPYSTTGLVAQWDFNETSGTVADNEGSCGATCDGTLTNMTTTGQDNGINTGWTAVNRKWGGGALMFDGSDDYVTLSDNSLLDLDTSDFTLEVWVNSTMAQNDSYPMIISKDGGTTRYGYDLVLMGSTSSGIDSPYFEIRSGGTGINVVSGVNIRDGLWHHLVAVKTSTQTSIYVDGKLKGSSSHSLGTLSNPYNLTFGAYAGNTASHMFNGRIDATHIYSRALSSSEILSNYNSTNIEFLTRTSADGNTWEEWRPSTDVIQVDSMDTVTMTPPDPITCTGASSVNGDTYVFTGSGTFTCTENTTVDLLVVGGGGSGGSHVGNSTGVGAGGGGAGGVTYINDYNLADAEKIVIFNSVGSQSYTIPSGVTLVDVLIVGGGGSGGSHVGVGTGVGAGGGGAGGIEYHTNYGVTPGSSVTVTVGAGGTAPSAGQGANGSSSAFGSFSVSGGGGGGYRDSANGRSGGSGGGASYNGTGGGSVSGQGYNGGSGGSNNYGAAGGGGAGAAGTSASGSRAGTSGGVGKYYGSYFGTAYGVNGWFGGGGGGGAQDGYSGGVGGTGGGGTGGSSSNGINAVDGSGGGGGGAGDYNWKGGDGGNGIVIIKYKVTNPTISVTVGSGGTALTGSGQGRDGGTSYFGSVFGAAGGGGGYRDSANGRSGGSGGGASYNGTGGGSVSGQGYNGGSGGSNNYGAAGGGGAGAAGTSASGSSAGTSGGVGKYYGDIFGINYGSSGWFGGGGGGGALDGYSGGVGGTGGGGLGGSNSNGINAIDGTGGGGGGSGDGGWKGGDGGNGIIIIVVHQKPLDPEKLYPSQDQSLKQEGTSSAKMRVGYAAIDYYTIGLWHFEETGGSGAYIKDETDNNSDGTPTGTSVVNGISGKARSFNGSSDLITTGTTNRPTNNFTIEAWFTVESTHEIDVESTTTTTGVSGQKYLFGAKNMGTDSGAGVSVGTNGISVYEHGNSYMPPLAVYSGTIPSGWNYLAVVYDNKQPKIYLNGVLVRTGLTSPKTNVYAPIQIGGGSYGYHDGMIDEVRISNVARTVSEIYGTYRSGREGYSSQEFSSTNISSSSKLQYYVASDSPGTYLESIIGETSFSDSNTMGFWRFEEEYGTGAYMKDSSINSFGGIPTGTTVSDGIYGKSRKFNGTSDIITVAENDKLDPSQITIEAWINPTVLQSGNFVNKGDNSGYRFRTLSDGTVQFLDRGAANILTSVSTITTGKWWYVVVTGDSSGLKMYINGILDNSNSTAYGGPNTSSDLVFGRYATSEYYSGYLDEVKISNVARSATYIRQEYEKGLRKHSITIDFGASLDSSNLIVNSSDTSFTIDATAKGLSKMGSGIYEGEKLIVKENYNGTEYIAQGTVSSVDIDTGAVSVYSWDSGSTFPSLGYYSINADIFKWQKEYIDLSNVRNDDIDAINNITFKILDGNEGRNIWIDDISASTYLSDPNGTVNVSSTLNRYIQYMAVVTTSDTDVTPYLSNVTINYTANTGPSMDQVMRHGKWFNSSGQKQNFWWVD